MFINKNWLFFICIGGIFLLGGATFSVNENDDISLEQKSVAEVLQQLGDAPLPHQPNFTLNGVSAQAGEDLVLRGITPDPKGNGKVKRQSRHFVCTSCHNVERENPDLSVVDPQARLEFVIEKGLPFLQGTALYGAVNRTSFYNGDYQKKYGDLVRPARNNIREAIQLCAVECSQGRKLETWELESVLAYLWTIDLKMSDLILTEMEKKSIASALEGNNTDTALISLIKTKYLSGAPATFVDAPKDRSLGYQRPDNVRMGDPDNGRLVYEHSCLHCHENERYSFLNLDKSKYALQFLNNYFDKYNELSVYHVTRYGTKPEPGSRAYMPNYTLEKLSNEMVEDLRAYVEGF